MTFVKNSSTQLWPVHLKPNDGELLSSWLVRLSIAHGLKPSNFFSAIWSPKIWSQCDIDRIINRAFLEFIAERTGTSLNKVLATSLTEYQGRLFEIQSSAGTTPWLMPYDDGRTRKAIYFGLQYCPFCLLEDKAPYFRRHWRLAFVVFCVKHNVMLLDRCAKCFGTINFYLNTQNEYKRGDSLTVCHQCKSDLREATSKITYIHDTDILNFQKNLLESAEHDWAEIPYIEQLYSLMFFDGLRNLAYALVGRHPSTRDLLRRALEYYGIQAMTPQLPRRATFEALGLNIRRAVILVIQKLLDYWPNEFINFNKSIGIEISPWTRKRLRNTPPFWYWSIIELHLRKPRYVPSDQEIESIFEYCRKKGREATRRELSKYLNYSRFHHVTRNNSESINRTAVRLVLVSFDKLLRAPPVTLSDEQWRKILSILRSCPRVIIGPQWRCRRFLSAVLWISRSGVPWQQMPKQYGKWNSIYKRFSRWCERGVWEKLHGECSNDPGLEHLLIDSIIAHDHPCTTGSPKKARRTRLTNQYILANKY